MGRPIKKSNFGTGGSNQIKVRAKIGSAAEGFGYIVAQKGSNKYIVTVGSDTGLCTLVDKANGTLSAGDMTITVKDSSNAISRVMKVKAHTVASSDGSTKVWSFATAAGTVIEMEQASDSFTIPVITISAQPTAASVSSGATATFTVAATATLSATVSYQWQVQTGGTGSFTNLSNGSGYSNVTTATLSIVTTSGMNTNNYRCVVSATGGATSVNSTAVLLTVS